MNSSDRALFVCVLLFSSLQSSKGQVASPANNQTPAAITKSRDTKPRSNTNEGDVYEQRDLFRNQAKAALEREMSREKAGDCPKPMPTAEEDSCLGKEIEKTTANYKEYAVAVRSLLGLKYPGDESPTKDPNGAIPITSEESVRQFDKVEANWRAYYKAQCSSVYDNWRGGSIAPIMAALCNLQVIRNHMRELDEVYDPMLWH